MEYSLLIRKYTMRPLALSYDVHGDSMSYGNPETIRDGDLVLVDTFLTNLAPDKIHLVELPGQDPVVKRLRRLGDTLWFMSDNPISGSFSAEDTVLVVRRTYRKVSCGQAI